MSHPKRTSGRLVVVGIFAIIAVFAVLIVVMALRADPPPPEPAPPGASLVPRQIDPPDAGPAMAPGP
ncbi:MAG TPA: hypothetical protein VML75_09775 [Kofleriaceae bacterium]|nr:hypothetical protein [Kofleriaceae bacterium]